MKRLLVPALPFGLSLTLSLCTVGTTVGWQDSGFFLTGVRDLGVLYPPGFVFYLVLCKVWTLLFGFLDFTLAVHLFSSACAAAAAGVIAVAARELLRSTGPLFRVGTGEGDAEIPAIVAGGLAAAGFSFWSAALLAKGYALLYLLLSLLIWRMIRADASGKPRDFTIVAVLIGLAWAAHPSATTVGPALILFVVAQRRRLGGKGLAWRTGLAAACAIAPSLLLPWLASRDPATQFGHPVSAGEWVRYLRGGRFTDLPGVFGVDSFRVVNALKYLWEDFLVVGLLAALAGLARIAAVNRPLLLGVAAWVLPSAVVATLFRIEGQQDFWLVAAWLPLHLAVALGLASIPAKYARAAAISLGLAGLGWSVAANARAVSMRGDTLAEQFGRFHLQNLEQDAILLLESDDALATVQYLQAVKEFRRDVLVVDAARLGTGWYEERLKRLDRRLQVGGPTDVRRFALANVGRSRPVYFEAAPADLPGLAPAGPLQRLAPEGEANEPRAWDFPVRMEDVRARFGRERGIRLELLPGDLAVEAEPYERRWISAYSRAQVLQGSYYFGKGTAEDLRRAAGAYEAARAAEPDRPSAAVLPMLGTCRFLLREYDQAEPLLKQSLRLALAPRQRVRICAHLAMICTQQGRAQEAARWREQGMAVVNSDPDLRREYGQSAAPK